MNKKNFILTIATGLILANGVFASNLTTEKDDRVISSVTYIDDDVDFELGFDTAEYLPEGFNPYKVYIDLEAVIFIEDEATDSVNTKKYLPSNFNAYAYPTDVAAFNYIDEKDTVEMDFDSQPYLPNGFDPYEGSEKATKQLSR
ncbi:hypothetical protein LCGC14_2012650 [marine sediment metagenome]|uniref:Uncharacterized protein n=2 Tax=root TaxID=1 RepID=A0A831QK28_9FLAO|nr:hypothetical protein [Pricia antarctica]